MNGLVDKSRGMRDTHSLFTLQGTTGDAVPQHVADDGCFSLAL